MPFWSKEMSRQLLGSLRLLIVAPVWRLFKLQHQTKLFLPLNIIKFFFCRISYDPKRYPRYIPEAYCLCKGCLIGSRGEESTQFRSTLVYAPSVILRRTGSCVGGRHTYMEIYVSIAVGCTCVPLLEKRRKPQKSNQSLQRREPKARQLFTARKEAWRKQDCGTADRFFCTWFTPAVTFETSDGIMSSWTCLSLVQSFYRQTDWHKANKNLSFSGLIFNDMFSLVHLISDVLECNVQSKRCEEEWKCSDSRCWRRRDFQHETDKCNAMKTEGLKVQSVT